jgi:hypothetical protein
MASITIAIWVDSDGNAKVEADDYEAFDNLDGSLAIRRVVLNVEVPEPQEVEEVDVEVPAEEPTGKPIVKVGAVPVEDWEHEPILEPAQSIPEPVVKSRWFGR